MMKRLLMLAACALMIVSAAAFRPGTAYNDLWIAAVWMLAGGLTLWAALVRSGVGKQLTAPAIILDHPLHPIHWIMAGGGTILLALLAGANASLIDSTTTDAQFALLLGGLVFLTCGLGGVRIPAIPWPMLVILTALTVIALVLRLWQLNTAFRFFVDELAFATGVRNLWADEKTALLLPMEGTAAFPYLFAYGQSKLVALLGRNLAGLRALSAIIGALTIPAVYGLGCTLFSRRVALAAAALLVAFPPHLHFSRLGLTEIASSLSGTLALAFLMRGLLHNRRFDFAAGGVMLGLTHYFHESGRLLFTPLAVVCIAAYLLIDRPVGRRKGLAISAAAMLIVATPIYSTLTAANLPVTPRFAAQNVTLGGDYWRELFTSGDWAWHFRRHIAEPFLMIVHQPERALFYMGQSPMLLEFLVPPFLMGLLVSLWSWRRLGFRLLILWLMAVWFGNSVLMNSATMPRYVVLFPAVVLFVAVGLDTVLTALLPTRERGAHALLAVLILVSSVAQIRYYFEWHIPLYNVQFRMDWGHRDAQDAVLRSAGFPSGTRIHIISRRPPDRFITHGLLLFLRDDLNLDLLTPDEVTSEYLNNLKRDEGYAFFIDPNEPALLERLRQQFTLDGPFASPYDLPTKDQFVLYIEP